MLDTQTKRTINNARAVLVGKVPNPLVQVDLITTAMIYKFMDDMDQNSVSMGGNKGFFVDDLEKYAWNKLLSPTVGNNERLNLYTEALDKLPYAKNIPSLFRTIFKNTSLPFRDAKTLTMFLQEINNLTYDDSENSGDAYEYLLSILGVQKDAGQFRTPRHIIDFIVEIVNPTKTDTILDPACGTAGFLISAYKHILNTDKIAKKPLSFQEIKTITQNITGYDIDPTMQKLSLVNLYLHKFATPKVYEYDTLSSDDRWSDKFDIIFANPPFMTPKGGIRPHNKFGIKSNRAEVLFVDYFMEHLNLKGKAGFVVPEGIIFQSGTAYKTLRKMMVEDNYLYAVVSLPAGVFNPYSGVKTSLLFFDREFAKKTDKILFVDIKNDGYDLGAQRREIKDNDLPDALAFIKEYQKSYNQDLLLPSNCLLVEKSKIAENGEYNLTASRYKQTQDLTNSKWEMARLENLFLEIKNGKNVTQIDEKGKYRVSRIQTIANGAFDAEKTKWTNDDINPSDFLQCGDILLSHINSFEHLAKSAIFKLNEKIVHGVNLIKFRADKTKINPEYAIHIFKSPLFIEKAKTFAQKAVNQASIKVADLKTIEIPLPPLEVQEEIVKELDRYQAIIDGAQKVVDNWKPTFTINPNWEKVKLNTLISLSSGDFLPAKNHVDGDYFVYGGNGINGKHNAYNTLEKTIIIGRVGAYCGCVHITDGKSWITDNALIVKINSEKLNQDFLKLALSKLELHRFAKIGGQPSISQSSVLEQEIPLPSLEEQKSIVAKTEQEEKYVDACKKLIELNKQKIADKIKSIWNSEE